MFAFFLGCSYLISALITLFLIKEKFNILGFIYNQNNKKYTTNNLNNSLIKTIDTTANFILLEFSHEKIANKFVKFLYTNKITVRHLASYGLPKYVRMTIGSLTEMKKTIKICNRFDV